MVYLTDIQGYFVTWYNFLLEFWNLLITPDFASLVGEWAGELITLDFGTSVILNWGAVFISNILGFLYGDASLLEILLGSALFFFIGYTLITWLLNIIT